jgi:hypothetical protein
MANSTEANTKAPGWENGAFSPDDLERFAQAFRPSWELDQAPFRAPSPDDTLSDADMQALQAVGANKDLRGGRTLMMNGGPAAVAPAAPPAQTPLEASVAKAAFESFPLPPPGPKPQVPRHQAGYGATVRMDPTPRSAGARSLARASAPLPSRASSTDEVFVPRKSRTGLFVGITVAALVAVGGVGALVMMGSGSNAESSPVPPPATTTAVKAEAHPVPPPPPAAETPVAATTQTATATATAKATADTPPPPPPATTTAKAAPPPPPPPTVAAAPPPRPPPAAPRNPGNSGNTAPAKPKGGGGTIVHDVPF